MSSLKRDRVGQLVRHVMDANLDAELGQGLHDLGIEIGDRPRIKPDLPDRAVVGRCDQRGIQKIELELEAAVTIGDGRRGQAPGRQIKNNVPGMIEPGRLREPDLANDLGPEMQGCVGFFPGRVGQIRPRRTRTIYCCCHLRLPFIAPPGSRSGITIKARDVAKAGTFVEITR